MTKIRLLATVVVATVVLAAVVHADTTKQVRPAKIAPTSAPEINAAQTTALEARASIRSLQGYVLVTDVLDAFAGESESDNYKIPVNSGGQPSAIGLSESANWGVETGYVLAARVTRGDVNVDGIINVGDIVYLVSYLYKGGPQPCPVEAGDVNLDAIVNVGDVVYLVSYLYKGGPPPGCH
jgi:hypothetical protein